MQLFDNIPALVRIASFDVQAKMQQEALARGETYKPTLRPGIKPATLETAFWRARTIYRNDTGLIAYTPKSGDELQDKFKRMLSHVSADQLREVNGFEPVLADIRIMRNILGRIFQYRKQGQFDEKTEQIAKQLGYLKQKEQT